MKAPFPSVPDHLEHAVIIASANRPELVAVTVESLLDQTVAADVIVVSVPTFADVPAALLGREGIVVVISERGLPTQRNTGLAALPAVPELVTYIDDDALLAPDYFEQLRAFMADAPDVVLLTGLVVADGATEGRELSREEAMGALALAKGPRSEFVQDVTAAYGCNMTARGWVASKEPFDERMRLYAWQEDTDFSVRCHAYGRVVHYWGCVAAHLAVGTGRVDGRTMGFAQVVNPFYMWRKGTKARRVLLLDWRGSVCSNVLKFRDRSRPDRPGRLLGNLLGFREIVLHGGRPEAVEAVARRSRSRAATAATIGTRPTVGG